jgi:hypothetical protein
MRKGPGSAYDKWKALDIIFPAVYSCYDSSIDVEYFQ